jgi:GPH family glycoside/pentoside/hexuronide:cation symporter
MTETPTTLGPRPPVTFWTKMFYGLGSVAFGIKDNGYRVFLVLFYNLVVGLPPLKVGAAILLAMSIDCLIDPIIGQISDNLKSRWGRRHPLMYLSAIPVALSFLLLWNPPMSWSHDALFWYLVCVAVLGRSFITLYEIPSSALSAELSEDYDERAKILGWRYLFAWWGGLTLTVLMYTVFLAKTPQYPVGVLNPAGYKIYGTIGAILMLISIIASALGTHRFIPWLRQAPIAAPRTVFQTLGQMGQTLSNRNFVMITLVGLFAAIAQGISFTLGGYIATYFWGLSNTWTGILITDAYISSSLALIAAPMLSKRSGKKRAGAILLGLSVFAGFVPLLLRLIGWFPDNGDRIAGTDIPTIIPWLFLDGIIRNTLGIGAAILITAMLADIVEESEVSTGRRSEGLFFAFTSLIQKAVSGVGPFVATVILTVIAFPQKGGTENIPQSTVTNLALVYMPTLAVLYGIALVIMQAYKLSRAGHLENLRILAERTAESEGGGTTPLFP